MPSPNVELVRSMFAAWERGDYGSTAWAHPKIEFVVVNAARGDQAGPLPRKHAGLGGMGQAWRDVLSVWEDHRAQAQEYRELDDGRVLVLAGVSGRGRTSGMDLTQIQPKSAALFAFRDGKVTRLVIYADRDRALADVGLAP
jgi:ketosteroid isomerase-like protein